MLNKFTIISDRYGDQWLIETELDEDTFGSMLQDYQINNFKISTELSLEGFVEKLRSESFNINLYKLDNLFSWWAN